MTIPTIEVKLTLLDLMASIAARSTSTNFFTGIKPVFVLTENCEPALLFAAVANPADPLSGWNRLEALGVIWPGDTATEVCYLVPTVSGLWEKVRINTESGSWRARWLEEHKALYAEMFEGAMDCLAELLGKGVFRLFYIGPGLEIDQLLRLLQKAEALGFHSFVSGADVHNFGTIRGLLQFSHSSRLSRVKIISELSVQIET